MDNIIFIPIPVAELLGMMCDKMRDTIRQELAAASLDTGSVAPTVAQVITTKQLCEHFNITEPTVIRYRAKGLIPFFKIGSAVRYNLMEVQTALEKKKGRQKN